MGHDGQCTKAPRRIGPFASRVLQVGPETCRGGIPCSKARIETGGLYYRLDGVESECLPCEGLEVGVKPQEVKKVPVGRTEVVAEKSFDHSAAGQVFQRVRRSTAKRATGTTLKAVCRAPAVQPRASDYKPKERRD